MEKSIGIRRIILVNVLAILASVIIAIAVHAALPASVNVEDFDSVFVKLFGFEVVAVFYFVLLYLHCAIVMRYFGEKENVSKLQIGIRFGLAFAIIYLIGMQEILVEGSPFSTWGFDYVKYQFVMGIGDAIPVLILCIIISYFTTKRNTEIKIMKTLRISNAIMAIAVISIAITIERTICYNLNIISNNSNTYPIPCYLWTVLFGIALGIAYVLLYPFFADVKNIYSLSLRLAIITLGINWVIFNSFMGLILDGVMPDALLRSAIDVVALFLTSILVNRYVINSK